MTRYRYTGTKPYILAIDGEVHRLKTGDCIEIQNGKLKTRRLKKLLEEFEE